MESYIL